MGKEVTMLLPPLAVVITAVAHLCTPSLSEDFNQTQYETIFGLWLSIVYVPFLYENNSSPLGIRGILDMLFFCDRETN